MCGYKTDHCVIQPGVTGLSRVCVGIKQITVGYSLESQGSVGLYGYITEHCWIQP
ncbi:hypothetical protein DPMN_061517 [Dreissena polymorpha]|uniref:Uncharacterized protein n=1 Tax=Dreissena polymorpha TaxID=45954 RepID=A0A9D4C7X1_DREPO|nr:hypothetical protein DPMN_061517 [Dreissena polymorpha]